MVYFQKNWLICMVNVSKYTSHISCFTSFLAQICYTNLSKVKIPLDELVGSDGIFSHQKCEMSIFFGGELLFFVRFRGDGSA